jgi:hypothetical protein
VEGKRGSECLLKSVSNIDFNPIFFLKISIVHLVSFLLILLVIGGLILNIVTLNRNLKSKISIVGPILGIIGNVDYLLVGMFFLTSSVILLIIGAIFSAIQKPVK